MARIHDHRQVGAVAEHRDRREVEGVAGRGLEGADAPLTEHHLVVALEEDIAGGGEPLVERRRHRALDDHGQSRSSGGPQQRGVVHGAGADHESVDMGHELGHVLHLEGLGDDRQPGHAPRFIEQVEAGAAHPLEGLWVGARLVDAAAQQRGSGLGGGPHVGDVVGFDGARPADHRDRQATDESSADGDGARPRGARGAGDQGVDLHCEYLREVSGSLRGALPRTDPSLMKPASVTTAR